MFSGLKFFVTMPGSTAEMRELSRDLVFQALAWLPFIAGAAALNIIRDRIEILELVVLVLLLLELFGQYLIRLKRWRLKKSE